MHAPVVETRAPGRLLVLSLFTCGFYLFSWYFRMYEELEELTGEPITTTGYWLDLLFTVLSCSVYGIWIDYRISQQLHDFEIERGLPAPGDTAMMAVILDGLAYLSGFFSNYVTSALHQDQLNKIVRKLNQGPPASF
jgi:hypothetical protein